MTDIFPQPFDALTPGQRFTTRGRTVTEADVVGFANLTGDHHPQHVDAAWSAESSFGERIAHGLLVLSYAAGLVPFDPARVIALRRVRDAVFKRPVRLGDTICVVGRVAGVSPIDERCGLVAVALDVRGTDGRTVMRATIDVVWAREPVEASDDDDGLPPVEITGVVHTLTSVPL